MAKTWITVAAALTLGTIPPQSERVVTGDGVVAVAVNGTPARLRIDPGALAMPMLDADLAARAELEGGRLDFSYAFTVGATLIAGHTATGAIALGDTRIVRRVAWNARRYQADVDGVIGPGGLSEPLVRFQLRPARAGERTRTLPLLGDVGSGDDRGPSYATVPLGDLPLRIRFSPRLARSWLDASTANRIATGYGATFTGAAEAEVIAFGVARPVRPLTLARPLVVGPLSLTRLGVRTAEGKDTSAIPDANTPPPPVDPDEVVVTARPGRPRPGTLTLGADALARCSSIVFDKPAREVRLTCG